MNASHAALRVTALVGAVAATAVGGWRLLLAPTNDLLDHRGIANWPVDRLATDVAAAAGLVALVGFTMTMVLALVSALAAVRCPAAAALCRRITPRGCRRLVAAVLGVGLAAAPAGVTSLAAATPHVVPCQVRCPERAGHLDGLPFPDLPTAAARGHPQTVVVSPGDSLWRIAVRLLPPDAALADVAGLTDRLYALNRHTIGPDPDLIFPGMSLRAPEGTP